MRRSLSVKATYDGVVRLPMSLAMISTLRERKEAHQNSSLVSPRHPRRRPSRASSSPSSSRFPRSVAMKEISRGRRRNAARVATRPRPVPRPGRPNDTHKKTTRSLARVPRRIAADHRASIVSLAAIRIIARVIFIDRRLGGEKRPIRCARVPTRTHRSCCQTPTHEYVVPRSIPIAGPSALLMMTRDARVCLAES